MKRIMALLLCVSLLFAMPAVSFAAPESIGFFESQGEQDILTVTNPAKKYSTTYKNEYSISGFAYPGSNVYVYVYDPVSTLYKPCLKENVAISANVGASGIFVIPVELAAGKNTFLLRCEKDGIFQNTIFDINVLSISMFSIRDSLKNITINQ